MTMLKRIFNPAAGWLYVFHDAPELVPASERPVLLVPPGLTEIYQQFYGQSVQVIANEKFPA